MKLAPQKKLIEGNGIKNPEGIYLSTASELFGNAEVEKSKKACVLKAFERVFKKIMHLFPSLPS